MILTFFVCGICVFWRFMLNLPIAMLAHKGTCYLLLFSVPWVLVHLLFSPVSIKPAVYDGLAVAFSSRALAFSNDPIAKGKDPFATGNVFFAAGNDPIAAASATPTGEVKPGILAPGPGEALQGLVTLTGTTDVPGFVRIELAFAYQSDTTGTWFLLQQSDTRIKDGTLATWDTTTITDGTYRLRMRVFLQDGQVLEDTIDGLRVRNYTTVETSTPEPDTQPTGRATSTPTATPRPDFQPAVVAATPLPTNPVQVTAQHLQSSILRGVLAVLGAALLGLVYIGIRAIVRR